MKLGLFLVATALLTGATPALAQAGPQTITISVVGSGRDLGTIVAAQDLAAVVANISTRMSASHQGASGAGFRTGDIGLSENAFASFGGIFTQTINTGTQSHVQASTNVAIAGTFAAQSR
jgi:hypothetical protein